MNKHNTSQPANQAHSKDELSPYWRAVGGILWAGFMGAVLMMPVFIWATHQLDTGLGLMTRLFITSWAICSVPAAVAWLLAAEQHGRTTRGKRP